MRLVRLILLLACVCIPVSGITAEGTSPQYSTNSSDVVACQNQLNAIHEALQEYLHRNQSLPPSLSHLVKEGYISDPDAVVCPFVRTSGAQKNSEKGLVIPVFADRSYAYEFAAKNFKPVPGWTVRTYKERQMEVIGFGVPIVRCFAHRPVLNLGFDGRIYPSGNEWEDNFATSPEHRVILHDVLLLTNIVENGVIAELSEPRKADTDPRMLDLSTQYNASLLHLSQLDQSGKLLATYPEGVQKIGKIDFDARGLVHLTAQRFPIAFPESVQDIPVNRKCAKIHFLHGTMYAAPNGRTIASYIIHFTNGSKAEVPITYGRDVESCWFYRNQKSGLERVSPAWTTPLENVSPTGKSLRLYVSSWTNQTPDLDVASIEFKSDMTESAPFLLAITVE